MRPGFTFIELTVGLAITMLRAFIGIPSYATLQRNVALRTTGQDIVSALRTAQNQSASSQSGVAHGVRFEAGQYTIFPLPWGSAGAITYSFPGSLALVSAPADITFERLSGRSTTTDVVVGIPGSDQLTVHVDAEGSISIP